MRIGSLLLVGRQIFKVATEESLLVCVLASSNLPPLLLIIIGITGLCDMTTLYRCSKSTRAPWWVATSFQGPTLLIARIVASRHSLLRPLAIHIHPETIVFRHSLLDRSSLATW